MNLIEMKRAMKMYEDQRKALADEIAKMSADPTTAMDEIRAKKTELSEMEERIANLKALHDAEEKRQKMEIAIEEDAKNFATGKDSTVKAKAAFYRDALRGTEQKSYEGLGAIPTANADLGSGDKLLPTNLSNQLLVEPIEINPLRDICRVTNVTGLEEPKLGFTIEDADIADVTDKQTANEIAMEGDVVQYGRLKVKVKATVKDTVYHGTDVDLVSNIEANLRAALAKREKLFAFQTAASIATNSDTAHAHMSFYQESSGSTVIKSVTGATKYAAIVNALADLADDYAANASVVMKKADYYEMIQPLANNSETLFGGKPATILGYPVKFCDKADVPVVGDFQYYGINYDIGAVYDTDKDVDKGEYKFVLTAWGDQRIRLKSAFRLAIVQAGE